MAALRRHGGIIIDSSDGVVLLFEVAWLRFRLKHGLLQLRIMS
jgi:hypothetical protein